MSPFGPDAVVEAAPDAASCEVGGEAVILGLAADTYYGLNDVGALVWRLLQEGPCAVRALRDAVVAEFDVEPAVCEGDLVALLEAMAAHGLVRAAAPGDERRRRAA